MAYDIPDEIKYKEKIVGNLDMKQLFYVIIFGVLALFIFGMEVNEQLKTVSLGFIGVVGISFVFFNADEKAQDIIVYYAGIRKAPSNSKRTQKFFEVKEVKDDLAYLENGTMLAMIQVEPVNLNLIGESRKKALLENYCAFLNHLSIPVQILIRTTPITLNGYFDNFKQNKRKDILELYEDFRSFEEGFIEKYAVRRRYFYLVVPFRKKNGGKRDIKELNEILKIAQEKLGSCGLQNRRLKTEEIMEFLLSYSSSGKEEQEEVKLKKEEVSDDLFRSVITPSFDIKNNYAKINGEYHRVIRVAGYPRKVEDGWLQSFLSKNEGYDISMHLEPSTIRHMLVYLHNQIIQQTSDLMASTMKGTPNPALEIKKADTMRVYDTLYKGEEKLFYVSLYIDNKEENLEELDLLTEKCKANLHSLMMVPSPVKWRTADAIKSTIPLARDKLESKREFLTNSLKATFPFISPVDSNEKGVLFAHETDTLNPIFLDFEDMSNKHFFLIGISGSGKSYTSKYLLMQQLFKEETKTYILDPSGEYLGLCRQLNGQVIELSRTSDSVINLFDLTGDDYGNKMLSLISAFDILCGGITESQKSVLNKALKQVYRKKGILHNDSSTWDRKCPTFSDLKVVLDEMHEHIVTKKDYLQDPSVEALLNRVEMYCKGGIFGFLDNQTKIDVQNVLTCFDLSSLPAAVRPLCMFMVLDLIRKEIKKDLKAKLVLIDEGWALLKSREAGNYILEFVKTSRKYNTGIGFVTQEIEDLLNSQTGRTILNTASSKMLMRQNPSNIKLISKVLNLDDGIENYLLTAQKGHGLVISEKGEHKFSVSVSPKIHALITTDPKDAVKPKKEEKTEEKASEKEEMKLDNGLYLKSDLTEDEVLYLLGKGYQQHKSKLEQRGAVRNYLVKVRGHESVEHAYLVWSTYYELRKKFEVVEFPATVGADVIARVNKHTTVCFEIETGSNLEKLGVERVKQKFDRLKCHYNDIYIVVSDWTLKRRYSNFGKTITRNEIGQTIENLPREYNS